MTIKIIIIIIIFFEVQRIGPAHQAGSDSLLTGQTWFKMVEIYFEDELDDTKVTTNNQCCYRVIDINRTTIMAFSTPVI